MTHIILVRHGQASFGTRNYDVLSELGKRQSLLLGQHWARTGASYDQWFSGNLARQKDTAAGTLAGLGLTDVAVQILPQFNEFDFEALITAYLPVLAQEDKSFTVDKRALFADRMLFQTLFEKIVGCWTAGRTGATAVAESWEDFNARVIDGLHTIARPPAQRIVVFTSGGVIASALRAALGVSSETAFSLNWRIWNASVHHLRFGRRGLSLLGFNNISHLELQRDPVLISQR